jgi:hypothetical protein
MVAQRDIAGQEFGFRIRAAVAEPMLLRQLVGGLGIARREQLASDQLALAPPRGRPDRAVGMREQ